jgi:hypothetical protein
MKKVTDSEITSREKDDVLMNEKRKNEAILSDLRNQEFS